MRLGESLSWGRSRRVRGNFTGKQRRVRGRSRGGGQGGGANKGFRAQARVKDAHFCPKTEHQRRGGVVYMITNLLNLDTRKHDTILECVLYMRVSYTRDGTVFWGPVNLGKNKH